MYLLGTPGTIGELDKKATEPETLVQSTFPRNTDSRIDTSAMYTDPPVNGGRSYIPP